MREAPDPERPVVCFDESPTQLIGEVRQPIPAKPGQLERYDCEYRRNGTVNLFVFLDVHRPWRKVKVTERRAAEDFAQCMRELSRCPLPKSRENPGRDGQSVHPFGQAHSIKHSRPPRRGAFCAALEFHYTPKHASWLNMVEIEIGVLRSQCLDRRIDDRKHLIAEIAAWERHNATPRARINWMFTTEKARAKLAAPTGPCQRVIISVQRY
jgi:hypothetical protein